MAFSYLCFVLSFSAIIISVSVKAQMVPAVYVFGDSLADVGNNNRIRLSLLKANFPHNGVDFPGGKATGRFSNGKNAADFLAEKLGLPTSPPYLSLVSASNKSNAFMAGVSFASGGAGILDGPSKTFGECIPLNKQIQYYSAVYGEIVQQLGSVEAQKHLSKSLFAVVIGSNDILGYFKSGSDERPKYTPQQFVDLLVSNLKDQLKRIYNLGARKFVVVGAGAIGCCPSQRRQNKTWECNQEANYWSQKYNDGLKAVLEGVKSEFKDMTYSFFDTYSLFLEYIQRPATYGFTEVRAACCGLGTLNARVPCLPISKYCSNRKDHIFWDLYHPTERTSSMFTDTIFDGSQQYVYPINVKQLIAV